MADARDPLAAFDEAVLEAVADEEGVAGDALADLVRRHQRGMRELPGVLDLVYEWRRTLPYDPLVERTEAAFHVVLTEAVWAEFLDAHDLSARERRALLAVHDRQVRHALDEGEREADDPLYGGAPMVLTRP